MLGVGTVGVEYEVQAKSGGVVGATRKVEAFARGFLHESSIVEWARRGVKRELWVNYTWWRISGIWLRWFVAARRAKR